MASNLQKNMMAKKRKSEKLSMEDSGWSKFIVSDFVIVNYEGEYYPEVIKDLANNKSMHEYNDYKRIKQVEMARRTKPNLVGSVPNYGEN